MNDQQGNSPQWPSQPSYGQQPQSHSQSQWGQQVPPQQQQPQQGNYDAPTVPIYLPPGHQPSHMAAHPGQFHHAPHPPTRKKNIWHWYRGRGKVAQVSIGSSLILLLCLCSCFSFAAIAGTTAPPKPPAAQVVTQSPTTASHTVQATPTATSTPLPTPTNTPAPTATTAPPPTPVPTLAPTTAPTPIPTQPQPMPTPQPTQSTGVNGNPWGYSFVPGNLIYSPPSDFCSYFNCIASFWQHTNGYVDECNDGTYSHSGGVRGACSYHGGEMRPLYSH